jgi:hypothetical protein
MLSQSSEYIRLTNHLVSKPKKPQNLRPPLYSAGTPYGHLRGAIKSLKTAKPLKQRIQDSRHFGGVDSELASWETSKHVS